MRIKQTNWSLSPKETNVGLYIRQYTCYIIPLMHQKKKREKKRKMLDNKK